MQRILIVEDQLDLLESIRRGLVSEGFQVFCAHTGKQGLSLCTEVSPDIVILDLMLPDGDGLQLLNNLRKNRFQKPVLIVSARDSVDQRVAGLNCGADDYLTKPFVFSELLARVRALLRRTDGPAESILAADDLVLDLVTRRVTRGGKEIDLTPRQFDILAYLMKRCNEVISREMLARDVWRAETATWTNVIEVQINRLRSKLAVPSRPQLVTTVRGKGYVFSEQEP
jgi:DNA-binding response OmpR family regulator